MAEFCPECWNKINHFNDPPEAYTLSWNLDICEGCGQWKRVVIGRRKSILVMLFLTIINKIKHRR